MRENQPPKTQPASTSACEYPCVSTRLCISRVPQDPAGEQEADLQNLQSSPSQSI